MTYLHYILTCRKAENDNLPTACFYPIALSETDTFKKKKKSPLPEGHNFSAAFWITPRFQEGIFQFTDLYTDYFQYSVYLQYSKQTEIL